MVKQLKTVNNKQTAVFWAATQRSVMGGCRRFEEIWWILQGYRIVSKWKWNCSVMREFNF